MNTAEMWLAAQSDGEKYQTGDMRYRKDLGFCDTQGKFWPPTAFGAIDDIMALEWKTCREMTRAAAERALGVDIID